MVMLTQLVPSNSKASSTPAVFPLTKAITVIPVTGWPSRVTSAMNVAGTLGRTVGSRSGSSQGSSPSQMPSPSESAMQLPSQSSPASAKVQEPSSMVAPPS